MGSENIKQRLSHFLKGLQTKKKLTAQDAADELGYEFRYYKRFLDESTDSFSNAYVMIEKFAKLNEMTPSAFLAYLDGQTDFGQQDSWLQEISKNFSQLDMSIRRFLTKKVLKSLEEGKITEDKFNLIIGIACISATLDKTDIESISNLLISLAKKSDHTPEVNTDDFKESNIQVAKIRNILK